MNIKYILGIIVIILLLSNILCFYTMQNNKSGAILDENQFQIPNGYVVSANDEVILSNGTDQVKIFKLNGSDLKTSVNQYKDKFSDNYSIDVKQFDSKADDMKTISKQNNNTIVKYWFKINDSLYQIQVSKDSKEYDTLARDIISSFN